MPTAAGKSRPKTSGKLWNDTIHHYLLELGFRRIQLDPCLYFRWREGKLTVLGLYVDDVVVVSQRENDSDWTMQKLVDQFHIKDMGPAKKYLGINIEQSDRGIYLHQATNIDGLLAKCGIENSRPVTTPMESTRELNEEDSEPFDDTSSMWETIRSLLWISNCTRPDITMPVNYLARFVARPTAAHWTAVKCILRYLRGSRELKLYFPRPQAPRYTIEAAIFSDADWAGDKDTKSTSGGLLTINAMPIAWHSKKQSTVALSTAEAEYIAGATAVQDCLWVKQLLDELDLRGKDDNIDLYIDNQSAIKNMENDVTTARMKHINIKFQFIRDTIRKKQITVTYCPTTVMKADIFTKPLGKTLHERNLQRHNVFVRPAHKSVRKKSTATMRCRSALLLPATVLLSSVNGHATAIADMVTPNVPSVGTPNPRAAENAENAEDCQPGGRRRSQSFGDLGQGGIENGR
ncbi:hypothetical protein ON010_g10934 [Phytophthora cinnamomi]|nr:hypothetical protein ON010_g10934 [Phytophthora cinnamomi]